MKKEQKNFFSGQSSKKDCAIIAYDLLRTNKNKQVSTRQIMQEYYAQKVEYTYEQYDKEFPKLNNDDEYRNAGKQAILFVCDALRDKYPGCLKIEEKNNQNYYTYVGEDDDPLYDLRNATVKKKLKDYIEIMNMYGSLFPTTILEHCLKDTAEWVDIKNERNRGDEIMHPYSDSVLRNIDKLYIFFEATKEHKVLKLHMKPFIQSECDVVLHPHYLKEYNGRWFVFGYGIRTMGEEETTFDRFNLPIDRIEGEVEELDAEFIPQEEGFSYADYFNEMVGVTPGIYNGVENIETDIEDVVIRTHSEYMHGLVTTKKFHPVQIETKPFGKHEDSDKKYGEVSLRVRLNNELVGKILCFGPQIEVVAPETLRERLKADSERLAQMYK